MPTFDSFTRHENSIYPAYCFSRSPTFNTWVKLTCADIHQLRAEPGFEGGANMPSIHCMSVTSNGLSYIIATGQDICFFLNHPIRFVRLVGPIVSITDYGTNLIILSLDDGSGSTVELKITRGSSSTKTKETESSEGNNGLPTDVPSLIIQTTRSGVLDLLSSAIPLCIGTVVKAKGTLCAFRGERQISLCRLSVIRNTEEEAKAWIELAKFRSEILLRPWSLTPKEIRDLMEDHQRELRRKSIKASKLKHRERKTKMKKEVTCEKLEQRRRFLEQKFNKGALV